MLRITRTAAMVALLVFFPFVAPCFAQTGANVAVVINANSPASIQIGEYYAKKRAVPDENIIRIKSSVLEEIGRADYSSSIEFPVADALARNRIQDRILYIVLTKGVPLRISGSLGRNGTTASVDSELTLLYRRMIGRAVPAAGVIENPYYLGSDGEAGAKPFSHRFHDIFLVTRLDGFTVDDVLVLIDRADAPSTGGAIVLDQRAQPAAEVGDRWAAEAARNVRALAPDRTVLLEESQQSAATTEAVIGYYSVGFTNKATGRGSGLRFAPGAIGAALLSTDARTLYPPPAEWIPREGSTDRSHLFAGSTQPLVGDLIRDGVTGAAANVAEPYLQSALRPEVLFPAYLAGRNLAEAFYLSLPHLSWQSVVIGDPLCAPFTVTAPLIASDLNPPIDSETELPQFFSLARLENARPAMKGLPTKAVSLTIRAQSRLQRGDKTGARQAFEEATGIAPGITAAQMSLAVMYEEAEEFALAIPRYRETIKAEPNNVIALNNLAYALAVRQAAPAEALPLARRAVALAPSNPRIIDTLAWVEHLLGNSLEAARLVAPVIRQSTGSADIHLHAAAIFAALGRRVEAETQLAEALRLAPALADRDDVKALRPRIEALKK